MNSGFQDIQDDVLPSFSRLGVKRYKKNKNSKRETVEVNVPIQPVNPSERFFFRGDVAKNKRKGNLAKRYFPKTA